MLKTDENGFVYDAVTGRYWMEMLRPEEEKVLDLIIVSPPRTKEWWAARDGITAAAIDALIRDDYLGYTHDKRLAATGKGLGYHSKVTIE